MEILLVFKKLKNEITSNESSSWPLLKSDDIEMADGISEVAGSKTNPQFGNDKASNEKTCLYS